MIDFARLRTTMVDTQVRPSDVTKLSIINAMLHTRREAFVPSEQREAAYVGSHVPLGDGRMMLEARTFAKMLDFLDLQSDDLVLDVACGLGYSSAVMSRLAQAVVALEDDAARVAEAQANLAAEGADAVIVEEGSLVDGLAQHAPFDVIILQGAVEHMPAALTDQLAEGGRIAAIFMDGPLGTVQIGYKIDGDITWRRVFDATAPLLQGFERHTAFVF